MPVIADERMPHPFRRQQSLSTLGEVLRRLHGEVHGAKAVVDELREVVLRERTQRLRDGIVPGVGLCRDEALINSEGQAAK